MCDEFLCHLEADTLVGPGDQGDAIVVCDGPTSLDVVLSAASHEEANLDHSSDSRLTAESSTSGRS